MLKLKLHRISHKPCKWEKRRSYKWNRVHQVDCGLAKLTIRGFSVGKFQSVIYSFFDISNVYLVHSAAIVKLP